MSESTTTVEMSAEEFKELQKFRKMQAEKAAEEKKRAERETYGNMVDREVMEAVSIARSCSDVMASVKTSIYGNFKTLLKMKAELFGVKEDQRSHTFTSTDGNMRVTLGFRSIDGYKDTADAGVQMVKNALEELGTDDKSRSLVKMVMDLLSRDTFGNLNAQRILQLEKVAAENHNAKMIEGVAIIKDAYQPTKTKEFIKVEIRGEQNEWMIIPLSMTEVSRIKNDSNDSETD